MYTLRGLYNIVYQLKQWIVCGVKQPMLTHHLECMDALPFDTTDLFPCQNPIGDRPRFPASQLI